jgi:YggT family protein
MAVACASNEARIEEPAMIPIIVFVRDVIDILVQLVVIVVVAYAVVSWLIAFNVINLRNRFVYNASRYLEMCAKPILSPIQRFLPTMGGLDFSPIIVIICLPLINRDLLHPFFAWLIVQAGGQVLV